MITKMKNPPAYPGAVFRDWDDKPQNGMSLLDHFAGLAMQGMNMNPGHGSGSEEFFQEQIRMSYRIARAMLEERAKPENQL